MAKMQKTLWVLWTSLTSYYKANSATTPLQFVILQPLEPVALNDLNTSPPSSLPLLQTTAHSSFPLSYKHHPWGLCIMVQMVSISLFMYRTQSLLSQSYQWSPGGQKTPPLSFPSTGHRHESWVCIGTWRTEEQLPDCSRHSAHSCFLIGWGTSIQLFNSYKFSGQ